MLNRSRPNKPVLALGVALVVATSFISAIASAQQSGERRGPPPEAVEACANLTTDSSCTFTGPRGNATGQCMSAPHNQQALVCMPAGGPPERGGNN